MLILAYHGTSLDDEHEWDPSLYMPPSLLRRRLELIRDSGCRVLPLDAAIQQLYSGELPPRCVSVTVDDGTYDFYCQGFRLFQSFGIPVTVYLTTYYANFNWPVYDTMSSYLLWKGRGRRIRWKEVFGTTEVELLGQGLDLARRRMSSYPREKRFSGAEKHELLAALAELLGIDFESICRRRLLHIMNTAEARELSQLGVDFQLHSHRHGVSFEKALFEREVTENRQNLKDLKTTASHFCYPGGVHRPEFLPWLREWNIVSATTCEAGMASSGTEPLLLPRLVDTSLLTEDEFVGWLSGIAAFLPKRRYVESEGQFLEERSRPAGIPRADDSRPKSRPMSSGRTRR